MRLNVNRLSAGNRESDRKKIVKMVCTILILIVFEGALRKWIFVFPIAQKLIIFIRDPLVIAIYIFSISKGRMRASPFVIAPILGLFGILFIVILQILTSSKPPVPVLIMYSLRNYLLYVPIVQVIRENFELPDVIKAIKIVLVGALISAPLMVLQSWFPPDSPINQGFGADEETVFENLGLAEGLVRGTGLFTSSAGNGLFSTIVFASVLGMFSGHHHLFKEDRKLLSIAMLCAVIIILYCGSRSVLFMVPVVLLGAIAGTAMSGRGLVASKIALVAAMFAVVVALVVVYIVPDRLDAYLVRFAEAEYYESSEYQLGTFGRIIGTFTNVFVLADRVPFFGYGAGYGTNAAVLLGYIPLSLSAESDWDRHVYDLGMIGWFGVALFRIWMTGWLGWRCLLAAKLPEGTLALTLYSGIAMTALSGQLVGQNSINGLGWFAIGLCAAASTKRQVARSTFR